MKKKKHGIQYTIRQVPESVDKAIRENCARDDRSINEYVVDALKGGVGLSDDSPIFHDLDKIAGSWVVDPECDKALAEFDKVDKELWKTEHDSPEPPTLDQ